MCVCQFVLTEKSEGLSIARKGGEHGPAGSPIKGHMRYVVSHNERANLKLSNHNFTHSRSSHARYSKLILQMSLLKENDNNKVMEDIDNTGRRLSLDRCQERFRFL